MITRIKWKNHNILGNLELDFTKEDGSAYNTIVIAGENGTGKTTILETLATFLSGGAITPFEYIVYEINGIKLMDYYENDDNNNHQWGWHKRQNINSRDVTVIKTNKNNNYDLMMNDQLDIRSYGVAYSKARSGFKTNQVKSTTTMQLDNDKIIIDDEEDFTSIKQLIIDISSQDNSDLHNLFEKNNGSISELEGQNYNSNTRMQRFINAFNSFFDSIKYDGINEQSPDEKVILFKKHGRNISIDSLSTGEKQIVFRGSSLLKNQRSINYGTVLIDEPELSMHPLWQEKILDYYQNLFKPFPYNDLLKDVQQNVQMIIATHSEYVIKSALEDRENVLVIALKNNNGKIESQRVITPTVLPSITLAETNYNTFSIISTDYHIQLYGYLQTLTGEDTITKCDKYIENYINSHHNIDKAIHFKQSSYIDKKGNVINYNTLSTYIRNTIDHPDNGNKYSDKELEASIKLLIEIIKNQKSGSGIN